MYRRASEISSSCRFRIVTPRMANAEPSACRPCQYHSPHSVAPVIDRSTNSATKIRDALEHRRPVLEHLRRAAETAAGMDGLRAPVFLREQRRDSTSIVPVHASANRLTMVCMPSNPVPAEATPLTSTCGTVEACGAGEVDRGCCRRCAPPVSYTHLRAHETDSYLVCRLLLE